MKTRTPELSDIVRDVLSAQGTGVLLTQGDDGPHGSIVAFVADEDLGRLAFVTPRSTSKATNIARHPRIAMMVDTRRGTPLDFDDAISVEAIGDAYEVDGAERDEILERHLRRHPGLAPFAGAPDIAVVAIDVLRFVVVRRLRVVEELRVASRPRSARAHAPR
jgi:nitroimidazol reductase NimA-like FMN-containing flavoprotein (pyridoxamine 5'-phosphate oxidase superfamily)